MAHGRSCLLLPWQCSYRGQKKPCHLVLGSRTAAIWSSTLESSCVTTYETYVLIITIIILPAILSCNYGMVHCVAVKRNWINVFYKCKPLFTGKLLATVLCTTMITTGYRLSVLHRLHLQSTFLCSHHFSVAKVAHRGKCDAAVVYQGNILSSILNFWSMLQRYHFHFFSSFFTVCLCKCGF